MSEQLGVREPELDYALGRVLGELYRRAIEDARKSGDKSYFEKQREQIEKEYLTPALAHLERCRGLPGVPATYLEGLIHFYRGRYAEALTSAASAREQISWLYEAAELEGNVFMTRALDGKDRGDNDQAERDFAQAVARYEAAAEIGRSDAQVYEALSEAWIRQEEMDLYRGKDPAPKLEKALAAADKALRAAPAESDGYTKKAFAYYFRAQYAVGHGAAREEVERLFQAQTDAGKQATLLHPNDAYAREITGLAYTKLAVYLLDLGQPVQTLLDPALAHLEQAIKLNPRFPWAYNDYGLALGYAGYDKKLRNEDPEELFKKAIDAIRKAIEIDDQYTMAYNNMSVFLNEWADWKANHGEDPEKIVLESVQAADRAIQINKQQPLPYGNSGLALAIVASYKLDAGQDGREPARQAIDRLKALLIIDPNRVYYQRELGRAYYLLASHERALGVDPRPSLDAGLAALEQCDRIRAGDAECKAVEAQLRAEQAEWARQQSQPFRETLEQAQQLASEAVQKVQGRAELSLSLGQICLQRAEALLKSKGSNVPAAPVVDEGLRGVEQALKHAPGMPRALAVQGALLVQKAETQTDPAQRRGTVDSARESLSRAFAANPLLKRRYGAAADEAKRLSEGP